MAQSIWPVTDANGNVYTYKVRQTNANADSEVPANFEETTNDVSFTPAVDVDGQSHTFDVVDTHKIAEMHLDMRLEWGGDALPKIKPDTWFVLERTSKPNTAPEQLDIQKFVDGTTEFNFGNYPVTDKDGNVYTYTIRQTNDKGINAVPEYFTEKQKDVVFTPQVDVIGQSHTFVVLDEHVISETQIEVKLDWEGEKLPPVKPDTWITLERTSDGQNYEKVKIEKFDTSQTKVDFGKYPVTDKDGKVYIYRIVQTDSSGNPRIPNGFDQKLIDVTWTPDPKTKDQKHVFELVNVKLVDKSQQKPHDKRKDTAMIPKTSDNSYGIFAYIVAGVVGFASVIGGRYFRKKDDK